MILPIKYIGPCLDCESKGTFQSYAGSINKVYSILFYRVAVGQSVVLLTRLAGSGTNMKIKWNACYALGEYTL
jgi:hypothetical protein